MDKNLEIPQNVARQAIIELAGGAENMNILFEYESGERSQAEIATRLGVSQVAVSKRISKARGTLRRFGLRKY
jgi:DNA-directed RNA polymerase specialized sigma subunit